MKREDLELNTWLVVSFSHNMRYKEEQSDGIILQKAKMRASRLHSSPGKPEIFIESTIYVAYVITKLLLESVASVIFLDSSNIRCDAAGINPSA